MRLIARTVLPAALLLGSVLFASGCGQGAWTHEGAVKAQEKMNVLKSGTDWGMAQQQFLAGDFEKAQKTIDRSIAMNPNVPKSHVLRGRIMLERSRLEEARAEFLEAERLDASNVDAQYYLGIVHERVSESEEALGRYRKAMELDTGNAQYVVAASEMLIAMNRLDEAEKLLNERKRFFQYNAAIRQTLGHISLLREDAATAATLFSEALLLAPGDQGITEDLIQAQMSCGKFADAETRLAKLLEADLNHDRRDLKAMRVRCLIAINRMVDARTVLQDLTSDRDGGSDVRAWINLGDVGAILHDKATLREAMNRVVAIAPERPEGYSLRAMYFRQENKLDEALTAVDLAITRSRGDAGPYVLKALILQDQGRIVEARTLALQGQNVDPQNARAATLLRALDHTLATPGDDGQ